jgi:hypothetical protein
MSGPGSCWIGEEQNKQVQDLLESGHLIRYGDQEAPRLKAKVYTLERDIAD